MKLNVLFLVIFYFQGSICSTDTDDQVFSPTFSFGVGTSAYQIEGAWNASGKGYGVWDYITHNLSSIIADGSNGDVACDSYNKMDEDIRILKDLGVTHYRFSLSWTRILPTGYLNKVNQEGVNYYNKLINTLLANNIQPWVTIYHWDHTYVSHVIGSWLQEQLSIQFAAYADLVFQLFGDRVKVWITINEPENICNSGLVLFGPYRPFGIIEYICSRNILRAHARAVRVYNKKYRATQNGKLSMAFSMQGLIPASNSTEDQEATRRTRDIMYGWFLYPCVYGNYPPMMIDRIAHYSIVQGYTNSRLPPLSCKEKKLLKGSIDFIGLNNYDTWMVQAKGKIDKSPSYQNDLGANIIKNPHWDDTTSLKMKQEGFGIILKYLQDNYNNMEIRITEQGIPDEPGTMNDTQRHNFIILQMREVLKQVSLGSKIIGYTFWSLMDNFEWAAGYTKRYGLYHVDFTDDARPRTPKLSASTFTQILKQKSLIGLQEINE